MYAKLPKRNYFKSVFDKTQAAAKGQVISKGFFGVFNFFQKMNENM